MTQAELDREVREAIEEALAAQAVPRAAWIAQGIVAAYHLAGAEVSDFDRLCAYGHVRATVRKQFQRYKLAATLPREQMLLPGHAHLQVAYLIARDIDGEEGEEGEVAHVPVPIDQLTDDDVAAKVAELRAIGHGCLAHADELERYHASRRAIVG